MVGIDEAVNNGKPPLGAALAAGVNFLSRSQSVTFTLYRKRVLPLDGFVFWVNYKLDKTIPVTIPGRITIKGSLHYSTEVGQDEDATVAYNTIVFTALSEIDVFKEIDPQYMYLADYDGIRFSFSSRGKFYQQADLYHYQGVAVSSVMETQVIDEASDLAALKQIVTNSLPIWLAMPEYRPPYPGFVCPFILFPSFLVPDNEPPPYGSVHIEDTTSLVETAFLGPRLQSNQLASETVTVTTYGVNADDIVTFLNFVIQYSYDWNFIGLMNMPIISDEKRTQSELRVIAQKKKIEFKVSYLQKSVRDIARQHILHAIVQPEATYEDVTSGRRSYDGQGSKRSHRYHSKASGRDTEKGERPPV
jgi:hypothetical protein